jgi:hypothetical protein
MVSISAAVNNGSTALGSIAQAGMVAPNPYLILSTSPPPLPHPRLTTMQYSTVSVPMQAPMPYSTARYPIRKHENSEKCEAA